MRAEECLREGKLEDALQQLQEQVRSDPSNVKHRLFLFQLLAVMGQWERALTQLNVAGELDAANLAMVQAYREVLRCEAYRSEVFAGKRIPLVLGQPEQWLALQMEAMRLGAEGNVAQSGKLRAQAFEQAPTTAGMIDGAPFAWIADADMRLGPILEAIVNGRYYWIPFTNIHKIKIDEPTDLRDVVWMPAHFIWANGGETVGMIPTRYPESETNDDGALRMARKTEWLEITTDSYIGVGQRILTTDAGDYSLMDVRLITLNVV